MSIKFADKLWNIEFNTFCSNFQEVLEIEYNISFENCGIFTPAFLAMILLIYANLRLKTKRQQRHIYSNHSQLGNLGKQDC